MAGIASHLGTRILCCLLASHLKQSDSTNYGYVCILCLLLMLSRLKATKRLRTKVAAYQSGGSDGLPTKRYSEASWLVVNARWIS